MLSMPVIRKGGTDMEGTNNETKTCIHCGHKMASTQQICPQCMKESPSVEETKTDTPEANETPRQEEASPENTEREEIMNPETESENDNAENTAQSQPAETPTDPGAENRNNANNDPEKKKRKKKIILAAVIAAVVLALFISIFALIPKDRIGGTFDEKTAVYFDAYGLTCYAPKGWTVKENTALYYTKDSTGNNDYQAALKVEYLGEYDSFKDVLKENEDHYNKESSSKVKIDNCKDAQVSDYINADDLYVHAYIVLCDRSAFWIGGLAQEEYFDAEEFDKIILAADFEDYTSATICEYLGGHDLPEDAEWEVTRESTCTKEGEEATECPVCLQTVTREIPMIDHKIEDGEVVESTCVEKGTVTGICSICEEEVTEELPLAEHTYGDWIVTKEATESSAGTRHKECTVCVEKTEDESFTLSLEEIKDSYNTGITYNQLARTPDDYEGEKVKFKGRVLQVMEGSYGITSLRVATKGRYDNVIYVTYLSSIVESRVLEDDTVTIYGTSKGLYSYESTGAGTITIPAVSADYID